MSSLLAPDVLNGYLAAIVESSDDAIIGKDLKGIIQTWNKGAERIFGYTASEAIGKHISLLAVPERIDEFPNILEQIARGERVEHYQTKRKTKDGRVLSISLSVSPIRDTAGRIVGASKIARDVTEQERSQQALRQLNATLARANADLEQFAYSASHDLQEPLRMVSTYGELLQRKFSGQLGEAGEEYIEYILTGATKMEQLLKDLRALIRASTPTPAKMEHVNANQALDRALTNLTAVIQESGASVTHDSLPPVLVNALQLEQLFQNLISNAVRYRSDEPPRIHITATESNDGCWIFSVQDNGIGIDAQYKEYIFGIFKRLHSAAEYPGTGMGLAICKRIVEGAGGRIWVESERGRGSTFLFTIGGAMDQETRSGREAPPHFAH